MSRDAIKMITVNIILRGTDEVENPENNVDKKYDNVKYQWTCDIKGNEFDKNYYSKYPKVVKDKVHILEN